MSEGFEKIEESELARFGEQIIRSPRAGAFERLLCQHLVLSVTGNSLDSIYHSCRAALSLPDDTAKQLEIDKEKVNNVLTVALNLQQAKMEKSDADQDQYRIIWGFSGLGEKGFKNYIEPWLTARLSFFLNPEDPLKLMKLDEKPRWERTYYACDHLTPSGFRALLTAFTAWAFPFVQDLNQRVSTQVSPTTYNEILSMFTKFKEKEE